MLFMGLDVGTSGCKSLVIDEAGYAVAQRYCEYDVVRQSGRHELDASAVWQGVQKVIAAAAADCRERKLGEVGAIGVSTFGESAVPVDAGGAPLAAAMLYTDQRGSEESEELRCTLGDDRIMSLTGVPPHPMYTVSKLMWLKRRRPEIDAKARRYLLFEDYIIFRLTGECVIDYSLASRTMSFDIVKKTWSAEILGAAGIDAGKLSRPVPSGTVAGVVRRDIASSLGLSSDVSVVTGGHDQVCAALGAGVLRPGLAIDGTGTVECIATAVGRPATGEKMRKSGYACAPHAVPGLYLIYAFSFTGGMLLKWFRDTLAAPEYEACRKAGASIYAQLDREASARPSGLLALPHFAGAATPYMDEGAKGAILGLTLETTKADIYRALMEGVTYEMLLNIEIMEKAGVTISELRATGGGAYSALWLQLKADIIGKPVMSLANCEAGAAGAAMLAATGVGRYPNLAAASEAVLKKGRVFEPDAEANKRYREEFEHYRRVYDAMRVIYGRDRQA